MGKRSDFPRVERDCYDTPPEAVWPLVPHLGGGVAYWEPCAGAGALIEALDCVDDHDDTPSIECVFRSDIAPRHRWAERRDALSDPLPPLCDIDHIITNPPWTRSILHPMIERFSAARPTWLLFDADWMHTRQSAPYLPRLKKIVSVGRVKWIKDSPHTGKDNCCWYLFDARHDGSPPQFFGRSFDG